MGHVIVVRKYITYKNMLGEGAFGEVSGSCDSRVKIYHLQEFVRGGCLWRGEWVM